MSTLPSDVSVKWICPLSIHWWIWREPTPASATAASRVKNSTSPVQGGQNPGTLLRPPGRTNHTSWLSVVIWNLFAFLVIRFRIGKR